MKGAEKIFKVYTALWDLLMYKKTLLSKLEASLKNMKGRDYARGDPGNELEENKDSVEVTVTDANVRVTLYKYEASFTLCNFKKNEQVDSGVILDLSSMLDLCDYLLKRYKFYNSLNVMI